MSDNEDSLELLGRQALQAQTALLTLADQMVLLALAAQTAWLGLWVLPVLHAQSDLKAETHRQERVARLIRRGIPAPLARRGLRLL